MDRHALKARQREIWRSGTPQTLTRKIVMKTETVEKRGTGIYR